MATHATVPTIKASKAKSRQYARSLTSVAYRVFCFLVSMVEGYPRISQRLTG